MTKRPIKLKVELTRNEAIALSQMVKRFGLHHARELASRYDTYDGVAEEDLILEATMQIQRALEAKGYSPR